MYESRIASATEFLSEDAVLAMCFGPALGLGYAGFRYMPDLAREFVAAYGLGQAEWEEHALSVWPQAYLGALFDFAGQNDRANAVALEPDVPAKFGRCRADRWLGRV